MIKKIIGLFILMSVIAYFLYETMTRSLFTDKIPAIIIVLYALLVLYALFRSFKVK